VKKLGMFGILLFVFHLAFTELLSMLKFILVRVLIAMSVYLSIIEEKNVAN
jgi:hypothetical protein